QRIEHLTTDQEVAGSNPAERATSELSFWPVLSRTERRSKCGAEAVTGCCPRSGSSCVVSRLRSWRRRGHHTQGYTPRRSSPADEPGRRPPCLPATRLSQPRSFLERECGEPMWQAGPVAGPSPSSGPLVRHG